MNSKRLLNRNYLVSGPLDDISGGIVSILLREGANVASTSSEELFCREFPGLARELGHRVLCLETDVRSESSIAGFVEAAKGHFGSIHGLVNDQVIIHPGNCEQCTREEYMDTFMVNQLSAFLFSKYALPSLKETRGSIVNITTMAAMRGLPDSAAYIPSRAGLIGLTRSMARDYAPAGVRVNAVAEGFIETPLLRSSPIYGSILARCPLGRLGSVEEIGNAVAFLCSDDASYITGIVLEVEGGVGLDY